MRLDMIFYLQENGVLRGVAKADLKLLLTASWKDSMELLLGHASGGTVMVRS
jgi:hypothetical protein